jgi:protoporphyrin/coproporphyrin ferrochelatase
MGSVLEEPKPPADCAISRYPETFFDAILVVAFGGPEGMNDVMPFLENVTRGRDIPRERLENVARHYERFGGRSPINDQNRALVDALRSELDAHGIDLPIYFGNRNWHPLLPDTLREMAEAGIERALAFVTSGFSSYSGCRQYRENIAAAQAAVGPGAPEVLKTRMFYNHPVFIEASAELVAASLAEISPGLRERAHLAFTAHSIPVAMASRSRYESQLAEASRLVAERVGVSQYRVVYQSRSGPAHAPWLGPDVCEHLGELRRLGADDVVVVPIGFVSDHMEVIYDLDVEAGEAASRLGLNLVRAATVGTHPAFVSMIRALVQERLGTDTSRPALGRHGPSHDVCPVGCCLRG